MMIDNLGGYLGKKYSIGTELPLRRYLGIWERMGYTMTGTQYCHLVGRSQG
jgi:hypothetical protein